MLPPTSPLPPQEVSFNICSFSYFVFIYGVAHAVFTLYRHLAILMIQHYFTCSHGLIIASTCTPLTWWPITIKMGGQHRMYFGLATCIWLTVALIPEWSSKSACPLLPWVYIALAMCQVILFLHVPLYCWMEWISTYKSCRYNYNMLCTVYREKTRYLVVVTFSNNSYVIYAWLS